MKRALPFLGLVVLVVLSVEAWYVWAHRSSIPIICTLFPHVSTMPSIRETVTGQTPAYARPQYEQALRYGYWTYSASGYFGNFGKEIILKTAAAGHTLEVRDAGGYVFMSEARKKGEVVYDGNVVITTSLACGGAPVSRPALSSDGKHYAYAAKFRNGFYVGLDDKISPVYALVENLRFEKESLTFDAISADLKNFLHVEVGAE